MNVDSIHSFTHFFFFFNECIQQGMFIICTHTKRSKWPFAVPMIWWFLAFEKSCLSWHLILLLRPGVIKILSTLCFCSLYSDQPHYVDNLYPLHRLTHKGFYEHIHCAESWSHKFPYRVKQAKLCLLYCHPPQLRLVTLDLWDSLKCMQSVPQPIALMAVAACQASGRLCPFT